MAAKWRLTGDYFENCNCDVVCPCLVSTAAPLTARPTQGVCNVPLVFHIDKGDYDGVSLDGLNVVVVAHTPGPMADGGWTLAAYIDERADEKQTAALGVIFSGGEGGPMAAFAPFVGKHLGVKKVPIKYSINGKARSVEIPTSCIWRSSLCPARIRAARLGARPVTPLLQTGLRSPWAPRVTRFPTTTCAGTILARTATSRRSIGRTSP